MYCLNKHPRKSEQFYVNIFSSMCFMLFLWVSLSVYCRFVFTIHGESGHGRGFCCRICYRHWEIWKAFSSAGVSTLIGCLYFKKVDYEKEAMLLVFWPLVTKNLWDHCLVYCDKVKGCVCLESITTKAMKMCTIFVLASSRNQQWCSSDPLWGVRHSNPHEYLVCWLTPWTKTDTCHGDGVLYF